MSIDNAIINKLQAWTYRQLRLGQTADEANSALHDVIAAFKDLDIVDIGGGLLLLSSQQNDFKHIEPIDPAAIDLLTDIASKVGSYLSPDLGIYGGVT